MAPPVEDGNSDNTSKLSEENGVRELPPEPVSVRLPQDDSQHVEDDDESTPLLGHGTDLERNNSAGSDTVESPPPRRSWWTIISIVILLVLTLNIIIFAFIVPSTTQDYAMQATTYTLHDVQVQEFTDDGLIVRAQVNVTIDSSRVQSSSSRNFGVFITSIFKHIYTKPCIVSLLLPQYNGAQVALVGLPALSIDIRNHHTNNLDITSNVTITNSSLAVQLAGDFLTGARKQVETIAETDVHIKAGWIPLGRHHVAQQVIVQGR
jgi:hypothetical protein